MCRLIAQVVLLVWLAPCAAHPGAVDAKGCHRDGSTQKVHCHPERISASPSPGRPPRAGDEGVFFGPVIAVIDGDSLRAKIQGVVMEFRLAGIDAPERDQPYGSRARDELQGLIRGKTAIIEFRDVDRYGRVVGDLWIDGLHVNRELVARGAAWFYPQFARDDTLYQVEQRVRDSKRGLWSLRPEDRIEPWIWRQRQQEAAAAKRQKQEAPR